MPNKVTFNCQGQACARGAKQDKIRRVVAEFHIEEGWLAVDGFAAAAACATRSPVCWLAFVVGHLVFRNHLCGCQLARPAAPLGSSSFLLPAPKMKMMRRRAAWWVVGAALCLVDVSEAFGSLPQTDGSTTRCWAIAEDPTVKQPSESNLVKDAEGVGCPFRVRFSLPSAALYDRPTRRAWTFTRGRRRRIGYKLPIPTIMEPVTGQLVQIVHSNIHACKYSSASVCDAFVDAEIVRDHTPNQPGNFTPGTSEATFVYSDLAFPTSGDMYVLAHLALPGPNATFRYDFAAYRRISILAAVAPPAAPLAPLPTQD
ncbi:hypothetical protein DYB32_010622, partial [Aphanomyces invadans]